MAGFIGGPAGDPARIRQAASVIEALRDDHDSDRRAVNEAVDELLHTWQGESAAAFQTRWYSGGGGAAPAHALAEMTRNLGQFAGQLRDYADQLEHAQHDHWIQTAMLTAMTAVNVAQGGLDPATDAAEVGMAAADTVSFGFDLANLGTLAFKGAVAGFGSGLAGQTGADIWDHFFEKGFDQSGDHAVGLFDAGELTVSTVAGGVGGTAIGAGVQLLRPLLARAIAPALSEERGFRLVAQSSATRHMDLRPVMVNPKWGLTAAHLERHLFGEGPYSLKTIDAAGTTDTWMQHMQDLAGRPTTAMLKNGMEDVIGAFPKADGTGDFSFGIRVVRNSSGGYDLVTLLTRQTP